MREEILDAKEESDRLEWEMEMSRKRKAAECNQAWIQRKKEELQLQQQLECQQQKMQYIQQAEKGTRE